MNERKVKYVYLLTSRDIIAFDEDMQVCVQAKNDLNNNRQYESLEKTAIEKLLNDKPDFFICRFNDWCHQIKESEFCYLMGHGDWYENIYLEYYKDNDDNNVIQIEKEAA